jgi:glycerophosphoryl diester phosphodiesterase
VSLPEGLLQPPFAHRGLWSAGEAAENSLSAIERACQSHYGVEFDVRLSRDGEVVVFHDDMLERMTGIDAPVSDLTLEELTDTLLQGGPDRIPSLAQVLELVAGRVMLLIELKAGPDPTGLASRVADHLDQYEGPVAVISFDPEPLAWFAAERPHVPRGLDAMWDAEFEADAAEVLARQIETCSAQFLVLEKQAAIGALASARRDDGLPVIAWTIRSTEDVELVADRCDNFIFEGFTA